MAPEALHFHLGLAIFLGLSFLLRRRRHGLVIAWGAVAALEIINEILDGRDRTIRFGEVNWAEAGRDVLTTLFWPTIILLVIRSIRRGSHEG